MAGARNEPPKVDPNGRTSNPRHKDTTNAAAAVTAAPSHAERESTYRTASPARNATSKASVVSMNTDLNTSGR